VYYDLEEFLKLSAFLNLQLFATGVGRENILAIILGRKVLAPADREVLLRVLEYLDAVYGRRRRRLGSLAVLHPLRAATLLARAPSEPTTLDLLTALLHDKLEDLTPAELGPNDYEQFETEFRDLLRRIDPTDQWYLMERLDWLTRCPGQTYFSYMGRLLKKSETTRELIRVKLADRLDNTLDTRIDIEDPMHGVDFFETVFKLMFVPGYRGYDPGFPHPARSPVNGAQRLYQLFKNAVVLSMIRQRGSIVGDPSAEWLFAALATASMKEAERIVLHILGYHAPDVSEQRRLVLETMEYAQSGDMGRVTFPSDKRRLDGLFLSTFENTGPASRDENLKRLSQNRPLMLQAALAFIVIYLSFLDDPAYFIADVSENGIHPRA
jgi:hypothetical protein